MMFRRLLFSFFFLALVVGCSSSKNGTPSQRMEKETGMLQTIYVDDISCSASISADEDLQITVKGNLPSPAYTFQKFDVEVKGNVIEITPLAKYDAGKMVTQIIVPFEQICTVPGLKSGKYDVKVNTRTETILKKDVVQVSE